MKSRRFLAVLLVLVPGQILAAAQSYQVKATHPRLLIENISAVAQRCTGPLAEDYRIVKERADAAVKRGDIEFISNPGQSLKT